MLSRRSRRVRLPLAVLVLAILVAACHPPATIVTPEGRRAYTADQIVVRVNELQQAAMAAEAVGGLLTDPTRILVKFAVSANYTLQTLPAGWLATVTTAWRQTKQELPTLTNPAVVAAIAAVDVVLGVVADGGPQ